MLDLSDLPVVDGHCHPLLRDPLEVSPEAFLDRLSEGRPGAMAAHAPHTGYYRRALGDLARHLGCEASVGSVLARRRVLGAEGARRLVEGSGVAALLVDTGYPPEAMALADMRRAMPCAIHEVWRIETCAQSLLSRGLGYEAFLDAFRAALVAAAREAVALKSIVAYRSGLGVARWDAAEAARSYALVLERVRAGGSPRLTEKPLLDTLFRIALGVCRETGRPLQVHAGFGDPDVDLVQANPVLLKTALDEGWADGVALVVLHMAYPYFREAAYLAAVWPGVHVDLSLALPFLGRGAAPAIAEMLSLAPASKLMYGSDVGGLPELFALSADWGRAALGDALGVLVGRGDVALGDALGIARRVLSTNARDLYRLPA